jgi:hypothetical protein
LLAFFAVEAFFLFFAMLLASSLSGVRAEGAGVVFTFRKFEMLHNFLSLPLVKPRLACGPQNGRPLLLVPSDRHQQLELV